MIDGDRGISELVFEGELKGGGRVRFENCNAYVFRDGRFAHVRVYGDAADMRRQLGQEAVPPA